MTTSSLREEIYKIFGAYDGEGLDETWAVNKILELLERRIDYIKETKEEHDYEGSYHGDEEFWSGYELGFDKAFEIIKKELLK